MKRFALLLVVILIAIIPLTLAQGQAEKTLVIGFASDIDNWNTVSQTLAAASVAQSYVFPALYYQDPMSGLPTSGAGLTSWEFSNEGKTLTFTIRDNASWSDGTPVTARDVEFTYNAINSDLVETTRKNWFDNIESIEVVDDKTIRFNYKAEDCGVWAKLTVRILPAHKFAADYSDFMTSDFFSKPDVFMGPFMLDEWAKDEYIRYKANPNYFNGKPNIDTVVLKIMPDAAVRKQALAKGEIDLLGITPAEISEFAGNENVNINTASLNTWFILAFNLADPADPKPGRDEKGGYIEQTPNPFFGDVRVRQAIAQGWNHDDAVAFIGEGVRRIVGTITPSISWAYDFNIEPWAYDPDAAAALLDEAGWVLNEATGIREKDGVPFEFQLDVPAGADYYAATGQIIQDQLGQLGIKVNINLQEFPSLITQRLYPQTFDAFLVNFTWTQPDPHVLTNIFLNSTNDTLSGGLNLISYVNEDMDKLIQQANTVPGCAPEDRAPLYSQILKITHDNVIADFISDGVSVIGTTKRVQNYTLGPWGTNPYEQWTLAD